MANEFVSVYRKAVIRYLRLWLATVDVHMDEEVQCEIIAAIGSVVRKAHIRQHHRPFVVG